ncbi:hypothetical protein TIFTF001_012382 [Ficus carica]|uniref:Secreted protein n=1 Tax=Ficus carica TaxID=3494 RepID=A0AA88D1P5_FICCA|nr:hypothetical protein TIFTF001_012382 [Ficus carica]
MPVLRTGVAFVLGAMCGALMTRGLQRCHHHEARRRWAKCARQMLVEKNASNPHENGNGTELSAAPNIVSNDVTPM